LAGVLVINSLKDNVNQERLSGNFQKKLNARLASEQGIYDSITTAQTLISNDPTTTIDDLITALNKSSGGTTLNYGATTYNIDVSEDSGELVLSSVGERFEGESTIKVRLKITPGTGGEGFSTFTDAIVGCEGVSLAGSGQIDSYNSNDGAYSNSSPGTEGHVKTIDHVLGDVSLGGNSPIFGDVIATGNLNTLSTTITGNVHANKDVIIGENGSGAITGNVLAGGNFFLGSSAVVGGYVDAVENVTISSNGGAIIHNNENRSEAIRYGGIVNNDNVAKTMYGAAPFKQAEGFSITKVKDSDTSADGYDPTNPDTNCDHLDVGNVVDIIKDNGNNTLSDFTSIGWSTSYTMTSTQLTRQGGSGLNPTSIVAELFGETTQFMSFGNFTLNNDTLNIAGDVTLFVDGDFSMTGNPRIKINNGSSLTLVITGKFNLLNGRITDNSGNTNASQSFKVYSSYASTSATDAGIIIQADFDMYAEVYAPLAHVDIDASGELYGAVRGKTVNVTGNARIHYDEALRESSQIGGTSTSTSSVLSFVGFEY
jgi:hypothetical protein